MKIGIGNRVWVYKGCILSEGTISGFFSGQLDGYYVHTTRHVNEPCIAECVFKYPEDAERLIAEIESDLNALEYNRHDVIQVMNENGGPK